MARQEERYYYLLTPRDILTPTATLLGLILTSLTILPTFLELDPRVITNFASVLILDVLIFILAVILTLVATLMRREIVFRVAIAFDIGGWGFLGSFLCLMLIGYAYGIESLQLPQFNVTIGVGMSTTISILSMIISILLFIWRSRIFAKKLTGLILRRPIVEESRVDNERKRVLATEKQDFRMSTVKLTIEIETMIRKIAMKAGIEVKRESVIVLARRLVEYGILGEDLLKRLLVLWRIRNSIVHGYLIPKGEAMRAVDLAASMLVRLKDLYSSVGATKGS